jgi:hypothetical protein
VVAIAFGEGDQEREYSYTTIDKDTLENIRNQLLEKINADPDAPVVASVGGTFTRLVLRTKIRGPEGEGLKISLRNVAFPTGTTGVSLSLDLYGPDRFCCSSTERAPVTEADPAVPNEQLIVLATGLGLARDDAPKAAQITGQAYDGPNPGEPVEFLNGQSGPSTMQVLNVVPQKGSVGIYEVLVQLPGNLPTNPRTIIWLGQGNAVSNQATIPVRGVDIIVLP